LFWINCGATKKVSANGSYAADYVENSKIGERRHNSDKTLAAWWKS
jgi:hypothetical protein